MKKIEIEFEENFSGNGELMPIHLGRLAIGNHIARLYFTPEGKTAMLIDKSAIEDGSILLSEVTMASSFVIEE